MYQKSGLTQKFAFITMFAGLLLFVFGLTMSPPGALQAQDGPEETEEPEDSSPAPENEDELIDRGRYLVHAVAACQDCHIGGGFYDDVYEDTMNASLAGGLVFANEPWGTVAAPNLTVLQDWTDEEIEFAIRYGVDPSGMPLLPPMPYELYTGMSDEDMAAIIAYLRSLEPEDVEIPAAELNDDLTREDIRQVPEFDPEATFEAPEKDDLLAYGTYHGANVAACGRCHGAPEEDNELLVDPEGPLNGTMTVYTDFGPLQFPSLLQEDIGTWSDEELFEVIHLGTLPDGDGLFFMPTYAYVNMDEDDARALVEWLRSQP
ncbi:MAG: cytochrome c [Chloroflexi bacterium]|nr:cytochrome c [Chloroflexota bacterium]